MVQIQAQQISFKIPPSCALSMSYACHAGRITCAWRDCAQTAGANAKPSFDCPNLSQCRRTNSMEEQSATTMTSQSFASLSKTAMSYLSSRSIHACAHLRNICSRSHVLPARPFVRLGSNRPALSLRDRALSCRQCCCASYHTSALHQSSNPLTISQLKQNVRLERRMSMRTNATVGADTTGTAVLEKSTTAAHNPLLEVGC